jgi:hypothetical protein
MDDTTILGSALGQLGQTAKKVGQNVAKLPSEMSKDLGEQIGVRSAGSTGVGEPKQEKKQWESNEERIKFLRDLYGANQPQAEVKDKTATSAEASAAKPEEQKEAIQLRNQLHKDNYYDPLVNPVEKQEERPAEKVENEKKVEMQELQQKDAKKPPPLAVVREQNKAEMFRGASG